MARSGLRTIARDLAFAKAPAVAAISDSIVYEPIAFKASPARPP
jgi:hypothetical protein